MLTSTQTLGTGAFLKSEGDDPIIFDEITVASGSGKLLAGTVLGKVTATGKYKPYDNDATDGTQTATHILYRDIDATSADVNVAAVTRLCEVWSERLVWGAGVTTQGEKDAAIVELAARFVIVR